VGDLDRTERRRSRHRAIVTTRSNRSLAAIHDRMPVIVPPAAFNLWLDCAAVDATTAAALFLPASDALLESYAVSNAVNRAANDSPELIVPAPASSTTVRTLLRPTRRRTPKTADKQLSCFDPSKARALTRCPAQIARDRPRLSPPESLIGERPHPGLALEGCGDIGRKLRGLARLARGRLGLEGRHHFGGE
jgi:Uncharacterized conserved protein